MIFTEPYYGRIIQFREVILAHHVHKGLKENAEDSQFLTCALFNLSLKKNNVTQRRLHLHIEICSFTSAEPARQNRYPKCTHENTFYGLPRNTLSLNSIDHGKLKPVRISFFVSSSSRTCHPLTNCISKYYKLSHKMSLC